MNSGAAKANALPGYLGGVAVDDGGLADDGVGRGGRGRHKQEGQENKDQTISHR